MMQGKGRGAQDVLSRRTEQEPSPVIFLQHGVDERNGECHREVVLFHAETADFALNERRGGRDLSSDGGDIKHKCTGAEKSRTDGRAQAEFPDIKTERHFERNCRSDEKKRINQDEQLGGGVDDARGVCPVTDVEIKDGSQKGNKARRPEVKVFTHVFRPLS